MDQNDFSNLGRQIQDSVQRAMDSMDFNQLNQTINQTVAQALDEARLHKERIQRQYEQNRMNQQYNQQKYRQPNQQARPNYQGNQQYAKPNYGTPNYAAPNYRPTDLTPVMKQRQLKRVLAPKLKKGTVKIILGAVSVAFSWWLLLIWLADVPNMLRENSFGLIAFSVVLLAMPALASTWLLVSGIIAKNNYRLAIKYAGLIDGRGFCQIQEMAARTGDSEVQIQKRLKKLIRKGYFREAYMDRQETCLMVDKESYDYYLQAEEARSQREAEEVKQKEEEAKISPEIIEMIRKGDEYIRTIREANDDIPGEVISEKLDRLETVVRRIFESVKKHPEQKKEMDKFMDYYMPTTLKLVNAYREFDGFEVKGTNIQSAMNEIENTLDTITAAFEKLLDDLFQDAAFDVSADISVLQTMLAREGYKEKDFK